MDNGKEERYPSCRKAKSDYTPDEDGVEEVEQAVIPENDRITIVQCAKKYKVSRIVLFGSAKERPYANDIDIGVKGLAPELFFDFCWELYRDLSKPADIIDLSKDCLFTRLIEQDGLVLYG